MKLYPHNQKAYNALVKLLKVEDEACIIHPTGTGKSLIIANMINKHPNAKHLVLAPGMHILEQIKKYTHKSFAFFTYQYLIYNVGILKGYDFIYTDEFHRIGADVWGNAFQTLLKNNPKAKIIGTSATNIRYLDDNRDMAVEVFKGNVASNISLRQAILDGILQAPDYVLGLYEPEKQFTKLENRVKRFYEKGQRKDILKKINTSRIDWERSHGVAKILKKYLTPDREKIIVFCNSIGHVEHVQNAFRPIFTKIYKTPKLITIHSANTETENAERMTEFNNSTNPIVLFCVDMINEGLHVEGCNTVILTRETASPILFYQQIGRAFSVNQDAPPMVIDLVQNLNKARSREVVLTDLSINSGVVGPTSGYRDSSKFPVRLHDETKGLTDILEHLSNQIEYFNVMYERAKEFVKEYKTLRSAYKYDPKLNNWLIYIRKLKKINNISAENISKMDSLGMEWEIVKRNEQYIIEVEDFLKDGNELPKNRKENKRIYDIINRLKKAYRENKLDINLINRASESFEITQSLQDEWNNSYQKAKEIFEREGYVLIPKTGHELSAWSTSNRIAQRKRSLTSERKRMLDKINFVFNTNDFAFDRNITKLRAFYIENKRYPKRSEDKKLQSFLAHIRYSFKNKNLTKKQINKLNHHLPGWASEEDRTAAAIEKHAATILSHFEINKSLKRKNGDRLTIAVNYIRNVNKRGELPYAIKNKLKDIPALL